MVAGDFLVRRVVFDDDGRALIGGKGYGVEVLDGGTYQHQNVITFGRESTGEEAGFTDDNALLCRTGARIVAEFDYLRLSSPSVATIHDAVLLRIQTKPNAVFTDGDPSGKPRARIISRSSGPTLIPATSAVILASFNVQDLEDDDTDAEHHRLCYFHGWVASRGRFTIHIVAKARNLTVPDEYYEIERLTSRDHTPSLLFPGVYWSQSWAADFTIGPTTSNAPCPVPWGQSQVVIRNTDPAGIDRNAEWVIGVRG